MPGTRSGTPWAVGSGLNVGKGDREGVQRLAGPVAGAENPPRRREDRRIAARIGSFVIWWVILMALWVWIDDSIALPELLVGAAAAAASALLAELVQYQAAAHMRVRFEWLARALPIPLYVARDLGLVFWALYRKVLAGEDPPSALQEIAVRSGGERASTVTRRVLLVMGTSVAPNTFALGIDEERDVMIVHKLVRPGSRGTR
ncbi:MAG: Na+/H+ antiporter subunit E [Acidimicrobiales bacterium]